MQTQSSSLNATIVGILIVAGMLALIFFSLRVSDSSILNGDHYTLVGDFDKANGLAPTNDVSIAGVKIGKVQELHYDPASGKVRVTMMIEQDMKVPVDSVASIRTKSLLGNYYVDFEPGDAIGTPYEEGAEVRTNTPPTFDELVESLGNLSDGADKLITQVNENQESLFGEIESILSENRDNIASATASLAEAGPKLNATLDEAKEIARAINAGEGTIGRLLKDDQLHTDVTATAENLKELTAQVREGKGSLGKLLAEDEMYERLQSTFKTAEESFAKLGQAGDEVQALLGENRESIKDALQAFADAGPAMQEALDNLREATNKINKGEGTIGKLVNDDKLYNSVTEAVDQIRETFEGGEEQSVMRTFLGLFIGPAI